MGRNGGSSARRGEEGEKKIESERPRWFLTASIDGYKQVHRSPEDACQQSEETATADPGQGDLRLLM